MKKIIVLTTLAILLLLGCISKEREEKPIEEILNASIMDAYAKFSVDRVEVVNYSQKDGSYRILLALINETDTPCPKRYYVTYIYPEQHFLTRIPELVAGKTCEPCSGPEDSRRLLFPEEAISATYSLGLVPKGSKPLKAWREGEIWHVIWDFEGKTLNVSITVGCKVTTFD